MTTILRDKTTTISNLYNRLAADKAHQVFNPCSAILSQALHNVEIDSNDQLSEAWTQGLEEHLNEYKCFEDNDHGYTIDYSFVLLTDYYNYNN